ncbi:MAG TPA: hypothetical protein VME46_22635 [Acidimicrobiales bacterium]|nr:hypothetical protein [Acidimicrobiales bacterium]
MTVLSTLAAVAALLVMAEAPIARADLAPITHAPDCTSSLTFGFVQATTAGCDLVQVSATEYQTTATVTINGIAFTPLPSTQVTIDLPTTASPGGSISADLQNPISAGGINWVGANRLFTWALPAGGPGAEQTVATTGTLNGEALFGFPIHGEAAIKIGCDSGTGALCYFKFAANLELPSVFKNGPSQDAGGLTATVGLRVDKNGVHADAIQLKVSNAYIGNLQIKSLCLSYVASGGTSATPCTPPPYQGESQYLQCTNPGNVNRWDGAAEVVLPTASRPAVAVYAGVQNSMFSYAGLQVANLGNALPIAQGIYLNSFRLALCLTPAPVKFKGGAGINIGPTVNGKAPLSINGDIAYTDSTPWVLEATGNALVEGDEVANGLLRYTSNGTIDFGFKAEFSFKVASVTGAVAGWIQGASPVRFNVDGTGSVCVSSVACASGEIAVSNNGVAGCFTLLNFSYPVIVKNDDWKWYAAWRVHTETRTKRVRAGIGYYWPTKQVSLMGDSCDVGPYRTIKSFGTMHRAAPNVAGSIPITVAAGSPALSLQITGTGGAPRVVVIGPHGRHYRDPASGDEIRPGVVFATDPATDTTAVEITGPKAGTWQVAPLGAGGTPIASVQQASVDEPPTIVAAVGGEGLKRTLGYAYQDGPGYTITFYEYGPDYEQELGVATGTACSGDSNISPVPICGSIPFTPDETPEAGEHQIIAVVTNSDTGETVEEVNVARYTPPSEAEPSAVTGLTASHANGNLVINWTGPTAPLPEALPVDYNVDIDLSGGAESLDVVPANTSNSYSVTIPGISLNAGANISVAPMRADDTDGQSEQLTLAPGQASISASP